MVLSTFFLAQVIGVLVTVTSIVSVQFKNLRYILIGSVLSNLLVSLNYALLGGLSGAGVCILATVQTFWIYLYNRKEASFPLPLNLGFMAGYTIVSALSFNGVPSVLSCLAAYLYALAVAQSDSKMYRVFMLLNSFLWIAYDIYTRAYTTIFTHGFLVVSILLAMYRLDRKKQ